MEEQLTSEIKLLSGKLNSLEEFRLQRDELMNKFKRQEKQMKDQENAHKNMLYEVERKFILKRDRLKREMEESLRELSTQFRGTTMKQVAANTQRTIRENIAINNELDLILKHVFDLTNINNDLQSMEQQRRLQFEILDYERKAALQKSNRQSKVLGKLKKEVEALKACEIELHRTEDWAHALEASMDGAEARLEGAAHVVRRLRAEVRLRDGRIKMQTRLAQQELTKCKKIETILRDAVMAIRATLGVCAEDSAAYPYLNQKIAQQDPDLAVSGDPNDPVWRLRQRENLLNQLLKLLMTAEEITAEADGEESQIDISMPTFEYKPGDLGLMKKEQPTAIEELLSSSYTEDE
ncbi:cilia- and flagella-associated protein 157 [Hetaerina americana]|uniref:cilia- and flagella-associated protein 157 n=1 Tax=Hetaerina americana TaxID=62018 RepID=UPI003A7F3C92